MLRLRKFVALGLSLWFFLSSGVAFALVSLEAEHDIEHAAAGDMLHDARDHAHEDSGIELLSQLFAQPGFNQLTSGWLTPHRVVVVQESFGVMSFALAADSVSSVPIPPPGPPPRIVAQLHRGGGLHG